MPYTVIPTAIPDILILQPLLFRDDRGFFLESFSQRGFQDATGLDVGFVQDNHSRSGGNVLRGLHYQVQQPQGKLVRVTQGEVFDVAVDIRAESPHFGKWVGTRLSGKNHHQMWIPAGFAHGFLVLSDSADFLYKATDYYAPEHERTLIWNDPDIGIEWPTASPPLTSSKDQDGHAFAQLAMT